MISNETLDLLIAGLEEYERDGVVDPWVLSDGSTVEPLEALRELREARADVARLEKERDEADDDRAKMHARLQRVIDGSKVLRAKGYTEAHVQAWRDRLRIEEEAHLSTIRELDEVRAALSLLANVTEHAIRRREVIEWASLVQAHDAARAALQEPKP